MVNIIGDHASAHQPFDAPLTADVADFARPVSHWVQSSSSARNVAADAAHAVQAARLPASKEAWPPRAYRLDRLSGWMEAFGRSRWHTRPCGLPPCK
jgi:hypothetical protein